MPVLNSNCMGSNGAVVPEPSVVSLIGGGMRVIEAICPVCKQTVRVYKDREGVVSIYPHAGID